MSPAAVAPLARSKNWWHKLVGTVLGRDGFLLLLSRVIQTSNGFALSVILVREFGLARLGTYTIAAVAIAALSLLCSMGLHYSLPREPLSAGGRNTVALCWAVLMIPAVLLIAITFGRTMAQRPGEWLDIALFACGGYFFGQTNVLNVLLLLQQRTRWAIVPPLVNTGGMIAGVLFGRNMAQFASILLIARACGSIWLFAGMKYGPVKPASVLRYGMSGLKYSPMDLIAMLSEQTGPLIMASIVTRAELGVYGLCVQFLTASDMPGWSVVQSHYPEMVRAPSETAPAVKARLLKLSFVVAFLVFAAATVLGHYVYKVPGFWLMMALLALSVPSRYLNNFYDQTVRAAGCLRIGTCLAGAKFLLALALFWILGQALGLWGAIIGLALLSAVSAALYARKALPIVSARK